MLKYNDGEEFPSSFCVGSSRGKPALVIEPAGEFRLYSYRVLSKYQLGEIIKDMAAAYALWDAE